MWDKASNANSNKNRREQTLATQTWRINEAEPEKSSEQKMNEDCVVVVVVGKCC
jgi:hypothetical protein